MTSMMTHPADSRTDQRVATARTDAAWRTWDATPAGDARDRLRDAIWTYQDRVDAGRSPSSVVGPLDAAELNAQAAVLDRLFGDVTEMTWADFAEAVSA
ncbi:hypothetical protein [Gordonia sputi]|uniref:hypothetical protein n=1 Tax=Gordonia sputi TaxID=36823 RepID=UPI00226FA695|nr:hypothetical protein [Gordonia sputi]